MSQVKTIMNCVQGFASVLSMLACCLFVWRISRQRVKYLLTRQLCQLAFAEGLLGAAWLFDSINDLKLNMLPQVNHDHVQACAFMLLLVSMFIELQLALGFVAVYWRRKGLLTFLRRTLLLPWVLVVPVVVHYAVAQSLDLAEWLSVVIVMLVFGLYVCASYRAMWYPAPAEKIADRMVLLYTLAFILTVGPLVVAKLADLPQECAETPASLNGFANMIVYSYVMKFSRQSRNVRVNSFHVSSCFHNWSGIHALPVGFTIENEERKVQIDQRRALAQSERDLRKLETELDTTSSDGTSV